MKGAVTTKPLKSTNHDLETILLFYKKYNKSSTSLQYPLFQAITLAFLKENNEEIKTIMENTETRDELLEFCKYVLNSQQPNILNIRSNLNNI